MKICVCGAQNTGKSTFIRDILLAYPEIYTPKYTYRDAISHNNLGDKINRNTDLASQTLILNAVVEELNHESNQTGVVIFDRSPMDVVGYCRWPNKYRKGDTDLTNEEIAKIKRRAAKEMQKYDLIIYIPVDDKIAMETDGLRDDDCEYREQMGKIFAALFSHKFGSGNFNKWGYKVAHISGTRDERLDQFKVIYEALTK